MNHPQFCKQFTLRLFSLSNLVVWGRGQFRKNTLRGIVLWRTNSPENDQQKQAINLKSFYDPWVDQNKRNNKTYVSFNMLRCLTYFCRCRIRFSNTTSLSTTWYNAGLQKKKDCNFIRDNSYRWIYMYMLFGSEFWDNFTSFK